MKCFLVLDLQYQKFRKIVIMNIEVKVTASAKSNSLKKENGIYYIRISAKAIDGKANKAIIDFLSSELNLKKKDVEILKGEKSSKKLISLNIDEDKLESYFTK